MFFNIKPCIQRGNNSNNNDKYLYSALLCVTQNAVTQNKGNTINEINKSNILL